MWNLLSSQTHLYYKLQEQAEKLGAKESRLEVIQKFITSQVKTRDTTNTGTLAASFRLFKSLSVGL